MPISGARVAGCLLRVSAAAPRSQGVIDDLRSSHDDDWAERAIEVQNDPVLESLDASDRLELAALRSALVRLDEGTYGTCSKCGKPIDERRLKAVPTTTACLSCAKSTYGP